MFAETTESAVQCVCTRSRSRPGNDLARAQADAYRARSPREAAAEAAARQQAGLGAV